MKKIILSIVILFTIGMSFNACTTDEINQKGTGNIDPVQVGILHNEYLAKTMNKLNKNSASKNGNKLRDIMMNFDVEGLSDTDKERILNDMSSVSITDMKQFTLSNLNNPLAIDYYNQIDSALDNLSSIDELNTNIDLIKEQVDANLTGSDWDIVMVYAETIKASAEFWYPIDLGGSGKGYSYILSKSSKSTVALKRTELPGWAKADGRGAGYGMAGWAMTGGLGGPVGFLGATFFSAVFSSADYAAYN